MASESYDKLEFYDCLGQVSNVSKFLAFCLFYDLIGDQGDKISGKVIIQKIKEAKTK